MDEIKSPNTYQRIATKHRRQGETPADRKNHYALGMIAELVELTEEFQDFGNTSHEDIKLEIGDCLFYVSQFADTVNCPLSRLISADDMAKTEEVRYVQVESCLDDMFHACGQIAGLVVADNYRSNKTVSPDQYVPYLKMYCASIVEIVQQMGFRLDSVMIANLQKLDKRHATVKI